MIGTIVYMSKDDTTLLTDAFKDDTSMRNIMDIDLTDLNLHPRSPKAFD